MGYVGNEPDVGFTSFAQQTITGNGGTSYTLSHAVANGKEILLYINNIKQEEGSSKAYTASGTTLTLSEAISSSDSCYCVFLGKALQTTVAPDGSVTSAKLANANLEMPNTLDMNGNELILDADGDTSITADTDDQIDIKIGGTDRLTIDSSGNLTVDGVVTVDRVINATTSADPWLKGVNSSGTETLFAKPDGTLHASGNVLVGKTTAGTDAGCQLESTGTGNFSRAGDLPLVLNRGTNDGVIASIRQADSQEGTIEVSGSTVSYNGFSGLHESSGIPTNTPIGTVVSTIDELDVYHAKQHGSMGEEDNPKAGQTRADHAKVEVSDTVGDSAVYGVVGKFNEQGKVMVVSVGIGSVRVTGACAKGDLLESNGDGTAKVQSDDIVRSKTIGKVTIGNSSTDEKLVSCVLYCG